MIFPVDPSIFKLGGRLMPGTLIKIANAKRTWEWEFKKGTGSSMGTSVFKGANLCEGFSVTVECVTEEEIAQVTDWRQYITPLTVKDKPVTFSIENWIINWQKIDRAAIKEIEQPEVTDTNSGVFTFTFGEINPPAPAKTGKADSAKSGAFVNGKPKDTELEKLQKEAASLGKQASAVTT